MAISDETIVGFLRAVFLDPKKVDQQKLAMVARAAADRIEALTAALPHMGGPYAKVFEFNGRIYFYERRSDRWRDWWHFIGSQPVASHDPAPELPPVYPLVQPWETRPQGDDALEPSEIEIHEGSWAIVVGTNAKPAGWIDTHALFAHQVFLDRLAPRPAPEPAKDGPEVVERLRKWCSETINQWSDEYEPRENWERQVSGAMREWDKATTEIISNYKALRAELIKSRNYWSEEFAKALRRAEAAEARVAELERALRFAREAVMSSLLDERVENPAQTEEVMVIDAALASNAHKHLELGQPGNDSIVRLEGKSGDKPFVEFIRESELKEWLQTYAHFSVDPITGIEQIVLPIRNCQIDIDVVPLPDVLEGYRISIEKMGASEFKGNQKEANL